MRYAIFIFTFFVLILCASCSDQKEQVPQRQSRVEERPKELPKEPYEIGQENLQPTQQTPAQKVSTELPKVSEAKRDELFQETFGQPFPKNDQARRAIEEVVKTKIAEKQAAFNGLISDKSQRSKLDEAYKEWRQAFFLAQAAGFKVVFMDDYGPSH